MRKTVEETSKRHVKKMSDLLESRGEDNTVKVIGAIDPPRFVIDLLSFGPKHPVGDEFNEMTF